MPAAGVGQTGRPLRAVGFLAIQESGVRPDQLALAQRFVECEPRRAVPAFAEVISKALGEAKIEVLRKSVLIDVLHAGLWPGAAEPDGQIKAVLSDVFGSHLILQANAVFRGVLYTVVTEVIHVFAAERQIQSFGNLRQGDFTPESELGLVIEALIPVVDGSESQSRFRLLQVAFVVAEEIIDPLGHFVGFARHCVFAVFQPVIL